MNIEEAKEVEKLLNEFKDLDRSLEKLSDEKLECVGVHMREMSDYYVIQTYDVILVPSITASYALENVLHRRNEIRDILSKIKY